MTFDRGCGFRCLADEHARRLHGGLVGWAFVVVIALAAPAWADFADQVDLSALRTLAVQHDQTIKTLDTYARQTIRTITGRETLDGHEPVYTLLDMAFHPDQYVTRNIIKIVNIPLRREFEVLDSIDADEKQRIEKQGTVSLAFLERPEIGDLLRDVQAQSVAKSKAIDQVMEALSEMEEICRLDRGFIPAEIVPPPNSTGDPLWHRPLELVGNVPALVDIMKEHGHEPVPAMEGYDDREPILADMFAAMGSIERGWDEQNTTLVADGSQNLAELMQQMNPQVYPSHVKREAEVIYNRLTMLTVPGALFYFVAFVLFVMSAQAQVPALRKWALRFMWGALSIHTAGIAIRWWLVGGAFPPIKNEFESVMFSAWFGAVLGTGLELRKPRGIFGAAASFVGMMSLMAIFAAPYVTGRQIGGEIGQVQGVLMSYWLYIHVTMVTASYSLIGMGFLLSTWWLVKYYTVGKSAAAVGPGSFLTTLDLCNLTVLQLAFWMLGAGIIFGAIWADQSWGRPWGWDPKETFALVTWMVYLIAVHVRVATVDKAWWTAVLGFAGFWVMLFNWIGVNFLLVGLHSYA